MFGGQMKEGDIVYYSNELDEDFSSKDSIVDNKIAKNYIYYSRNFFWKIHHFFWNKIVAYPVAYFNSKINYKWKVVNKKAFKQVKNSSYFIYGNHTQQFFDAGMSKIISNKEAYVLVDPANLNIKGLKWLVKKLGALPISEELDQTRKLVNAINKIVEDKHPIMIYPEAHIWPYYTKIRPFPSTSFRYPVKYKVPAFCFTNTYQKRKHSNKVKITTYVDGPFYPNMELSTKEQINELRDRIYNTMVERSKLSNYEFIKYVKKGENK